MIHWGQQKKKKTVVAVAIYMPICMDVCLIQYVDIAYKIVKNLGQIICIFGIRDIIKWAQCGPLCLPSQALVNRKLFFGFDFVPNTHNTSF